MSTPSAAPTIAVPVMKPPLEECDRILGYYMRSWDQLQLAQFALFSKLLDSNPQAAFCVFHAEISVKAIREKMIALGAQRLPVPEQTRLTALMRDVGRFATKRNRIVHGTWMMSIMIHRDKQGVERARTGVWLRQYQPPDLTMLHKMQSDPQVAKKYRYSVKQITTAAEQTRLLSRKIRAFAQAVTLQPYRPPQPLPIS